MPVKRLIASLMFALSMFASVPIAEATIINVDKTEDIFELGDSGCSLRNAFISADTDMQQGECEIGLGDDVIRLAAGTYKLDRVGANEAGGIFGDLDMLEAEAITLEPANSKAKVVIDGNGTDRIFDHVFPGVGKLTIRNIELTNGDPGIGGNGGLIRIGDGTVRLEGVTMSGGVGDDGGAVNVLAGNFEAVNSTFTDNHAEGSGGAIFNEFGSTVDLRSVTIAGNEADIDSNAIGDGGGVGFAGGATMTNSILANNSDLSGNPGDQHDDCASGASFFPRFVLSTQDLGAGFCLAGFDPGTNKDPQATILASLVDNGGPTRTLAIPADSPAVDAGGSVDPDLCPEKDQRGFARTVGACDLGSVEFGAEESLPDPLPGLKKPTLTTAVFDGTRLSVLVKCPARFKPKCASKVQALKAKNGAPISSVANATIKSGKTATVKLTVKPSFRELVDAMTFVDKRKLAVSHQVRSKKVGGKKAKKVAKLSLSLKVRIKN